MTEQSKIRVPSKATKGESLLERASGAFSLDALARPPVPKDLAPPVLKRGKARKAPEGIAPAPVEEAPVQFSAPSQEVHAEPAPVQTAPVEPMRFDAPAEEVDLAKLAEQGFIVPGGAVTTLLEEFRIVKRAVLEAARKSSKAQRVLISSPLPGEGKTFCATNLALAIAGEKDSEVLLVDADFAKPSVLSVLGLSGGANRSGGLMDALTDPSVQIEKCVVRTDIAGLYVLPAGTSTTSDSEYLNSRRTAEVLDRLTQGAPNRMVIFDSPPALAASPAAELAKHVGQTVLVARADMTGRSAMEDALQLLGSCRDIKLLLNDARFSPSGRRFGAYYGYGE